MLSDEKLIISGMFRGLNGKPHVGHWKIEMSQIQCIDSIALSSNINVLIIVSLYIFPRASFSPTQRHFKCKRDKRVAGVERPGGDGWQEGRDLQRGLQEDERRVEAVRAVRQPRALPSPAHWPEKHVSHGARPARPQKLHLWGGGCERCLRAHQTTAPIRFS